MPQVRGSHAGCRRAAQRAAPEERPRRRPGDLRRAVLRPRLRVRRDPALPPAAGAPLPARGDPDDAAADGRLVGLDLHVLGHQLARPRAAAGAADAVRADAGRPRALDLLAAGLRSARPRVRRRLRLHAGRAQPVHALGARPPPPRQPAQLPAHHALAGIRGRALDHGRPRRPHDPPWPLGRGPVRGISVALGRLLDPAPRPLEHRRLGHRGRPHRRALRPLHHHRARRIWSWSRGPPSAPCPGRSRPLQPFLRPSSAASPCGGSTSTSAPAAARG